MMEDAVTEFIVSSCIVCPQPNRNRVNGLLHTIHRTTRRGIDWTDKTTRTLTGSASEFFIEPMLRCCNDQDIMRYSSHVLIVPTRYHVPRYVQLPVEFHSSEEIELYEFVDIQIPCYCFIRFIGELRKSESDDSYTFVPANREYSYTGRLIEAEYINRQHGPALVTEEATKTIYNITGRRFELTFSVDVVNCSHCLEWPPQAAEWLLRVRRYDCPDTVTIQRVVDCGCDLVSVAHRRYKQYGVVKRLMHRISFSRAETLLLNSWTPMQQIVYHVLRYIVKNAGFIEQSAHAPTEQSEQSMNGIFHNYHLKTMMLWSCEQQSPQWWSLSLVSILTKLMYTLSLSLSYGECQHYFITDCNLLDYLAEFDSSTVEYVKSFLAIVTDESLSLWLVDTYISECAQLCPDNVSCLMNNINTTIELQYALTSIINWRVSDSKEQSAQEFYGLLLSCASKVWESDMTMHTLTYPRVVEGLRVADRRLADYCTALILLHSTREMLHKPFNFKIIELIRTLLDCEDSVNNLTSRSRSKSHNSFLTRGINILMKLEVTEVRSDKMFLIELAKAFFTESIINSIRNHQQHVQCLARIHLASLCYHTVQYQTAINQCLLVLKQCHDRCSSHVVDMQHLSRSDGDITVVSGLIAIYQFMMQTTSSNQCQQTPHISVVAAESYSFFLMIKCLSRLKSVDCKITKNLLCRYRKNLTKKQSLFIGDILLAFVPAMKKPARCEVYIRRTTREPVVPEIQSGRMNTVRLRCLLMKSAVERLTRVRQAASRDYRPVLTSVTTDYEAMYAYKCGEYEKCLQLC